MGEPTNLIRSVTVGLTFKNIKWPIDKESSVCIKSREMSQKKTVKTFELLREKIWPAQQQQQQSKQSKQSRQSKQSKQSKQNKQYQTPLP